MNLSPGLHRTTPEPPEPCSNLSRAPPSHPQTLSGLRPLSFQLLGENATPLALVVDFETDPPPTKEALGSTGEGRTSLTSEELLRQRSTTGDSARPSLSFSFFILSILLGIWHRPSRTKRYVSFSHKTSNTLELPMRMMLLVARVHPGNINKQLPQFLLSTNTVDGWNPAPPITWNDDSPLFTNKQRFLIVSKSFFCWCAFGLHGERKENYVNFKIPIEQKPI